MLAALLPIVILAFGLTAALVQRERDRSDLNQLQTARAIMFAVEAEMERSISSLQTLALHDTLKRGDLEAFRPAAVSARDALGLWTDVLVLGPAAEHLLNLKRAAGEPLPPLNDPHNVLETVRTRRPYVSHTIVRGALQDKPFISVSVPVFVDSAVRYVLLATMTSEYWSRWLAERAVNAGTVAIIDRDFVIFARSKDAEQTAGKPVQAWYREVLAAQDEGVVRGRGVIQSDVQPAFVRSARTGLRVNLVQPGHIIDAPVWRAAIVLVAGSLVTIATALLIAFWRARVLTRGIAVMRHALHQLRDPQPHVELERTGVAELDEALQVGRETAIALNERAGKIRELQHVLRARAEAAEDEARRKDEFLATLAHELRNPLAPITTSLELMRRQQPGAPGAVRTREIIERQVRHMTRLVNDLLDASRISTGKIQLQFADVAVAEVLDLAREAVAPLFEQSGIRLEMDLPGEPLTVRGDTTRLVQVMINLLTNAAKFSSSGSSVHVRAQADGAHARIEVRDQGVGLRQSDLERIFGMFSQVEPALERAHGGLGIGLALARGLVHAHGGEITASSKGPGHGSLFTVCLPLLPLVRSDRSTSIESRRPSPPRAGS